MGDKQLQQLIEDSMKKNQLSKIRNKEEELYTSIFEELNQLEEPKIPFQFSEKVTRQAIKSKAIQERFITKLKIIGLTLVSIIIAGIVFKIFKIKVDFLEALPLSYFVYGLGVLITFVLIEIVDFLLMKRINY